MKSGSRLSNWVTTPIALLRLAHLRRHRQAEGLDLAGVGAGQAEADADRRRLAGAVRADHAEALARHDLERQVVDDDVLSPNFFVSWAMRSSSAGMPSPRPEIRRCRRASVSTGTGRSTSSTKAIGALSPTRKPIFRIARVAARARLVARADLGEQLGDDVAVAQAVERRGGGWPASAPCRA